MSSLKLKTPSGGSVTFNATDTANDVTLTVPASNASVLTTTGDGSQLTNLPQPAALSTASGSAPSYSARAWVNFNTSGTVSIRQSGNVSSITDTATGQFTVNFATAMPDDGYSIVGQPSENGANSILLLVYRTGGGKTVNGCAIQTLIDSGGFVDTYDINIAVFR